MRIAAVVLTLVAVIAYVTVSDACLNGVNASDFLAVALGSPALVFSAGFLWKASTLEKADAGKLADELTSIFAGALLIFVGSGYAIYVTMKPIVAGFCF
jgi:hypothetical protein